jgi:phenylalanyl-tRNA synthetase beta chain
MKVPIAWLRDYVELTLNTDEIAATLAGLGFPVDAIERRPVLSGVVVGRLAAIEKHPNADRLQVCTVDIGAASTLTIATAATNVAVGQIVPVAKIGAQLAGMTIAPRKMRGLDSQGMLVSAGELGLAEDGFEDGILQLEADAPVGADFIALHSLNDDVLDVEITANRVDAMSLLGLARELGAALGLPVREPALDVAYTEPDSASDSAVVLETPDCKRFVAQRFSHVSAGVAPFHIRVRLALAGQRPIDSLVDVSNFVMLETGQPLHFYDYEKLAGRRLIVRDAKPGERLVTLDGEERTLQPVALVIADENEVQCLAGLRGAASSEVSGTTRELLLEAATFSGPRIRRMSVALGLRTDASSRHEKSLPLALSTLGAARAAHLLQAAGAAVHRPFAVGAEVVAAAAIRLTPEHVRALLGIALEASEIERALRALGFSVAHEGGALLATPPPWRGDVLLREDVIEEIGRVVGYDRIPSVQPAIVEQAISSKTYNDERRIAHALAAQGYREAVSLALQPASVREAYERAGVALPGEVVEIVNPLSEDQRYMRFSLLPGFLALVKRFEGEEPLRYFEIGHVFHGEVAPMGSAPSTETAQAAWLLATPKRPGEPDWRDAGFALFKGEAVAVVRALTGIEPDGAVARRDELHPGKSASLRAGEADVVAIGAVDPRLLAEYGIESDVYFGVLDVAAVPAYSVPRFAAPSRFPALERDLALLVSPDVGAGDIERAVRAAANGLLADVRVFDEYRGPQIEAGKKSLAVRVVLQSHAATLTDAEAETQVGAILSALEDRCGAKIRG